MRTFFFQLFLSFWVVTIGIFIGATVFFPNRDPGSFGDIKVSSEATKKELVEYAIARYRDVGCAGLAGLGNGFVLIEGNGTAICQAGLSEVEKDLVGSVLRSDSSAGRHVGSAYLEVTPVVLAAGGRWMILQRINSSRKPWFPPLPKSALPISIVVTFFFALLLTRPVRALSVAFRRFSNGDLSVRLPVSERRWSGLGGADVRSLMLDFNDMADRINELIDAQKLLVRDVSHELRSPLARLRLALEMTREESVVEPPSLDRMELEAERLNDLIGQMLTLSLIESTKELTHVERFTILEMLEELMLDMEFEAAARACSVRLLVQTEASAVEGNWELMRRAIENVIRNAIRFTVEGSEVLIELSEGSRRDLEGHAEELPFDARTLRVRISDRGPGVPSASLPNLFRAFYRTDSARRDSTGGFGVGLSIAERAVHLHGGTISARNRDGGGLVVEIMLLSAW